MNLRVLSASIMLSALIALSSCVKSPATNPPSETRASFAEVISLPNNFQPEGIAAGEGTTFYVGSIPTGAVYRGDLKTGEGEVLVPPQDGHSSIGLKYDSRSDLFFVVGGAIQQTR